jgi:TRAP transporter TAXI family solute receptor
VGEPRRFAAGAWLRTGVRHPCAGIEAKPVHPKREQPIMKKRPWEVGWLAVVGAAVFVSTTAAWADTEVDPGAVSEGLKAIFKYGHSTRQIAERLNANTITLMSGTIGGTYVQIGADLASALDDGDNLRVLPIIGRGSVQSVADILFLKGVDIGIVRSDTLDYLEEKGYADNIKKQFAYITKLYNEEMHVVAPKMIRGLADLEGKKVAVDLPNGGTFVTSMRVFERLGIHPNFAFIEQRIAYEKLRKGEIDAMIAVQGKPSKFTTTIKDTNMHLVPVGYANSLPRDYLPAELTSDDYPNLIESGERVDTIAVPAALAVYNWAPNTERYRKLTRFVEAFFSKFGVLQQPPFHPKWKEVAVNAPLPGWLRFRPAQEWLDRNSSAMVGSEMRSKFDQFLSDERVGSSAPIDPNREEELFRQFMEWQKTHLEAH